jgi:hypothetical protein
MLWPGAICVRNPALVVAYSGCPKWLRLKYFADPHRHRTTSPKPLTRRILHSFNNSETNAGLGVDIHCASHDGGLLYIQTQNAGLTMFRLPAARI